MSPVPRRREFFALVIATPTSRTSSPRAVSRAITSGCATIPAPRPASSPLTRSKTSTCQPRRRSMIAAKRPLMEPPMINARLGAFGCDMPTPCYAPRLFANARTFSVLCRQSLEERHGPDRARLFVPPRSDFCFGSGTGLRDDFFVRSSDQCHRIGHPDRRLLCGGDVGHYAIVRHSRHRQHRPSGLHHSRLLHRLHHQRARSGSIRSSPPSS